LQLVTLLLWLQIKPPLAATYNNVAVFQLSCTHVHIAIAACCWYNNPAHLRHTCHTEGWIISIQAQQA
jgi:hypothetical protein